MGAGGCISDFSSIANLVLGLRQDYFIPVSITDDSSKSSFIDHFLSGQPPVKLFISILLYNPHSPIVNLHLTAEVIRSSEKLHHSPQVTLRSQGVLCLPPEAKNSPPSSPRPTPGHGWTMSCVLHPARPVGFHPASQAPRGLGVLTKVKKGDRDVHPLLGYSRHGFPNARGF